MRIKFLSIIACFLFVSIAISSCLDSEDTYIVSSDATVQAFGLDTIHGKSYRFAIDQVGRKIYNLEPLPVGADTILDSILIDTFQVSGYITSGLTDTMLNLYAHQNLLSAINRIKYKTSGNGEDLKFENGLKFKIHAPDMSTTNEYILYIKVYEHNPDSMQWNSLHADGLPQDLANRQKLVILDDKLLNFVLDKDNSVALYSNTANCQLYNNSWTKNELKGIEIHQIPSIVKTADIDVPKTDLQERLFTAHENRVFQSNDGISWKVVESLTSPEGYVLEKLICNFANSLIGLFNQEGKLYLIQTNNERTAWLPQITELPAGFPTESIYSTTYLTANMLEQIMLVGKTEDAEEKVIPWAYDGKNWTSMNPESEYDSYCLTQKVGHQPTVMHYNNQFYIFGETLNFAYTSDTRLAWYEADKKFYFPKEMADKGNYTTAVDKDNYIWIITGNNGKSDQNKNEVWCGRLYKFGMNY